MAQLIRKWVMSCEQCVEKSRIDSRLTRQPLKNSNKHNTGSENARQIDWVPEPPPFSGFENKVTAMDMFSGYLFAYPTSGQEAKTIPRVKVKILNKHAYLPTMIISDRKSVFVFQVVKEVAEILCIILQHATTKLA